MLKAAIAIFIAKEGAELTMDTFSSELVAFGIDLVATAGMASIINACYEAYTLASRAVDTAKFLAMTKRNQAKHACWHGHMYM
jgi:hypothetical protein